MDFAFSEEQDEFRATLRRFLETRCPSAEVFRCLETEAGFDASLWKQMSGELGLPGIAIPEAYGGQGFGFLELGIVLEEMGRALLPSPFFATACLAASAIESAASEAQKAELLPAMAAGETLAALALAERGGGFDPDELRMQARPEGSAFRLEGEKTFVLDGAAAEIVVVAARLPATRGSDGLSLLVVRAGAPGVAVEPLPTLDPTRRQARLVFSGARAEMLGPPGGAAAALERTLDRASIGLAAEMAGGAQRCLADAVAWAKERRQFDRAIGSFQAVKHKCAEVLLEVESAKSAAWWACWAAHEDNAERGEAAHLAKSLCADAYLRAAAENIQIHGGIGFTWEATPHLHYRRAKVSESLFGDSVWHRARLAGKLQL